MMGKTKLVNRDGVTKILLPSGKMYDTQKKKISKIERDILDALDSLITPLEDRLLLIETKLLKIDDIELNVQAIREKTDKQV